LPLERETFVNRTWSASAVFVGITAALIGTGSKSAFAVDGPKVSLSGASVDFSEKKVYDQAVLDRGMPNGSNATLSYPVALSTPVAVDTSKGKECFVNHAEVPISIPPVARVKGTLKVDQTIQMSDFKASFVSASAGSDPYRVQIAFSLNDLKFNSVGALDISAECLGLDSSVAIQLKGVTGVLTYSPPVKGSREFKFKGASLKFSSVSVDSIPRTKLFTDAIAKLVESELKKSLEESKTKASIEEGLASALGSAVGSTFGQLFLDLRFQAEVVSSSDRMKDVTYYERGRYSGCASGSPCAVYSLQK